MEKYYLVQYVNKDSITPGWHLRNNLKMLWSKIIVDSVAIVSKDNINQLKIYLTSNIII